MMTSDHSEVVTSRPFWSPKRYPAFGLAHSKILRSDWPLHILSLYTTYTCVVSLFVHGQDQQFEQNIQQRTSCTFITTPIYYICVGRAIETNIKLPQGCQSIDFCFATVAGRGRWRGVDIHLREGCVDGLGSSAS